LVERCLKHRWVEGINSSHIGRELER
jgi:hypothetical protein